MGALNTLEESAEKELIEYGRWARITGNSELGHKSWLKYESPSNKRPEPLLISDDRACEIDRIFSWAGETAREPKHHDALACWLIDGWAYPKIGAKVLDCSHNQARAIVQRRFEKVAGMIMQSCSGL